MFLIFAIILGVLGLIFAGLAEFTGLARFPGLARFAGHAHIVRTAIASPGPPARGARVICYHELQKLHKTREFCQACRPTGTQRGNKSDPLYIYTQKKQKNLGPGDSEVTCGACDVGVLLLQEKPWRPTPSRQRHDPQATAALVSRKPRSSLGVEVPGGSSCPLSALANPHRLDSVTTRRRLLHWCQGCQGLEGTEALIVLSPGL